MENTMKSDLQLIEEERKHINQEFDRRIKELQDSCEHPIVIRVPFGFSRSADKCLKCEKRINIRNEL